MEITDEIYSRLDEKEVRIRIEQLGQEKRVAENTSEDLFAMFQEFIEWQNQKNKAHSKKCAYGTCLFIG